MTNKTRPTTRKTIWMYKNQSHTSLPLVALGASRTSNQLWVKRPAAGRQRAKPLQRTLSFLWPRPLSARTRCKRCGSSLQHKDQRHHYQRRPLCLVSHQEWSPAKSSGKCIVMSAFFAVFGNMLRSSLSRTDCHSDRNDCILVPPRNGS